MKPARNNACCMECEMEAMFRIDTPSAHSAIWNLGLASKRELASLGYTLNQQLEREFLKIETR